MRPHLAHIPASAPLPTTPAERNPANAEYTARRRPVIRRIRHDRVRFGDLFPCSTKLPHLARR